MYKEVFIIEEWRVDELQHDTAAYTHPFRRLK